MSISSVEPATSVEIVAGYPGRFFTDISGNEPIRAELYGLEHLEAHARELAKSSAVIPGMAAGHPLLRRFMRNGRRLAHAHRWITEATRLQESITPDAEWLLDNFHIVEDTLREVRQDLPRGYYKKLPKLAGPSFAGFPRIYTLALELIAHTDSSLDETNLTHFVQAYQTVSPLTIGEVWAVPIMLRLGLLENLSRLAQQMLEAWEHRREAAACSARLVGAKDRYLQAKPRPALASVLRPKADWSDAFVVRMLQELRDHGPEASGLIDWLEGHMFSRGCPSVDVLRREHQRQAANQVSVGNCVTSLRLLSALDWTVLFERMNLAEALLRDDPVGFYTRQDFSTRDRYRREIEKLARGTKYDELAVARQALSLARGEADAPRNHVGYYLVGPGRSLFETRLQYRAGFKDRLLSTALGHPKTVYFGALAAVFAAIVAGLVGYLGQFGFLVGAVFLLAALLPASELAVGIVHYLLTLLLPPRVLAKLDFKDGIPGDCTTFVVMPTLLLRAEGAAVLAERLEVHYLSNPDPHLRFALLTDFADAPAETMPEDSSYLLDAMERIKSLNGRYSNGGPDRFFLFHRRRTWNPVQGCWMGWERKRGKLVEFNRLLRGARDTSFAWMSADASELPFTRYVITLDADTQLPRETALRLIGTMAHPLNQPHFDSEQGRVVEGYGVLQPRVSLSLVAATRSLFTRIMTSSAGIDPYTTAVSDVYQDLFGVGSFTGKGIYEVDAFEAAVGHTFPDNRILSHDLIEGNYARCGLVTDIELIDDFPALYHAYARREHRWIRGDWQLLPWLFPTVPTGTKNSTRMNADYAGQRGSDNKGICANPPDPRSSACYSPCRNPLPALERWKISDNLRRSLVAPALVLLLALGWLLPGMSPWFWTFFVLAVPALPLLWIATGAGGNLLRGGSWQLKVRDIWEDFRSTAGQTLLTLIFLADQARLAVDAVARTLVRLTITHRNMLEWETAASTERRLGAGFVQFCLTMWPPPLLALGLTLALAVLRLASLSVAVPLLLAWFLSPAVAYWISRPRSAGDDPLTADEHHELRRLARKTWTFFETYVGAEDHWLPPDNYQENPKNEVAHRTSPTNVGLYLLSALAAHDFGYLSLSALLDRLEAAFDTLDRLDRFHGHFYNWYDTRTLAPLSPTYISTVDSGNLLGCLLALKQGLREKIEEPVPGPAVCEGLADTIRLVGEQLHSIEPPDAAEPLQVFQAIESDIKQFHVHLAVHPADLAGWLQWFEKLGRRATELASHVQVLTDTLHETPTDLQFWTERLAGQVRDHHQELISLAPWVEVLEQQAEGSEGSAAAGPKQPPLSDGRWGAKVEEGWRALCARLVAVGSVAEFHSEIEAALKELTSLEEQGIGAQGSAVSGNGSGPWPLDSLAAALQSSSAPELLSRCQHLADRANALAQEMDFRLLYNEQRHLFSIGYNLSLNRLDNAHYDLLASEARLASFLAIGRGDVSKKHWFHLGRPLTRAGGSIALLSWGGTMFEYLMPAVLLRAYPGTLLEESCRSAVARQIEYGRQQHVPWGISESAFSALDGAQNYQYLSFGVPGLGLKRGLTESLVIAPYATALALAVRPRAALQNFRALRNEKAEGTYGFYEAIDYTWDRRVEKRRPTIVRTYMAHHQGMSLVALANSLLGESQGLTPMVRRLHTEPMVRATELLLQERLPRVAPVLRPPVEEQPLAPQVHERLHPMSRRLTSPSTAHPRTHLLSNGSYHVMVTSAGSGYSAWRALDVTRWREDRTSDNWGQFCYVRDLRSGLVWSTGHQPICRNADDYEVIFSTDKAEFRRIDGGIETLLEITVSPENSAEVRRLTVTNHNPRAHELELTSYAEVVLNPHGQDLAHPAFGKLFLETEFLTHENAILCRRRPRSPEQKPVWGVHVLAVDGSHPGELQYETDRARFLGRGRTPASPAALEPGAVLSGTTGPVLDPIFCLRRRLRVGAGASLCVAFTTAVAESHEEALALADQYHDFHGVTRAFELAWAHSQVQLRHLRVGAEETHLYQRLAAHLLYAGSSLRAADALSANSQGQPGLWRHGISGDLPIVLVRVAEMDELALVRQLLLAHTYWRLKGLTVDLVILNEHPASYLEELQEQLQRLIRASESHALLDKPGGVFVRKSSHLSEEDRILLQAAARVILVGSLGSLAAQVDPSGLDRSDRSDRLPARLAIRESRRDGAKRKVAETAKRARSDLLFANSLGGFTADGREYCLFFGDEPATEARDRPGDRISRTRTQTRPDHDAFVLPPAPWINVVANRSFGFLVSETGGGYTWAGNSQANRLTPWNNDPAADVPGEVVYLRDETTGEYWTPTSLPRGQGSGVRRQGSEVGRQGNSLLTSDPWPPAADLSPCRVRHGQGYTIFEAESYGLAQELLLFVPADDPIKLIRLKVRNLGDRARQLSATFYAEWVLGTVRDNASVQVVPSLDPATGAILARNPFNTDFASRIAFADVNLRPRTVTSDRTEFLGRNGSVAAPAALARVGLSGRVAATHDPCAALIAPFTLQPGQEKEVVFFLGQVGGQQEVASLVRRYADPARVSEAFRELCRRWDRVLGTVQVRTPEPAVDLLLNRWLLYQVLSCRVWARSAFYQSGGAFGFRDQLQDVMALVYGAPDEERAHILNAASRQFLEGDVQHWWHPPAGRGVRTRFSDDFLWLPLVACHYVTTTGDMAILDERVPFLRAPLLRSDQEEDYGLPASTEEKATLYEHCVRALEHGLRFGGHGLPLMGTGDWNDGMNRVGHGGKGESVWNGWFLLTILQRFAALAEKRQDSERVARYRAEADRLSAAMEQHAWDAGEPGGGLGEPGGVSPRSSGQESEDKHLRGLTPTGSPEPRWYRRAYFDDGTPLGSAQNDECKIDSIAQSWAVISGVANPERARQAMASVEQFLVNEADKLLLLFTPPFDHGKLQPGYIKGYVPGIRENGGQYTHAAVWVVQALALLGRGNRALELFNLLNPIHHSRTREDVGRYRVEPYVLAGDVYGQPPHIGRGGWTWYTGSAGWFYRVGLENILGFHVEGAKLRIEPCIPSNWPLYEITYRYRSVTYHITVENPHQTERGVAQVTVDGKTQSDGVITLADDGRQHEVRVIMG
jgi:cyclic beta-1,2-glucan synthetase